MTICLRNAGAIILKIAYGYTIEPKGLDPLVDIADKALAQFSTASQPGIWLVDIVPLRQLTPMIHCRPLCSLTVISALVRNMPNWMPGTAFKRTAEEWRGTLMELAEKPFAFVKQQMVSSSS